MFRSTDGGLNYSEVTSSYTMGSNSRFYTSNTDLVTYNNTVHFTGGGTVTGLGWKNTFFSNDQGATWLPTSWTLGSEGIIVYDQQVLNSATRYAALSNGEIKKTTDGGQGWSTVLAASGVARTIAIHPNQPLVVYAGRSNGLYRSQDAGWGWSQMRTDNVLRVQLPSSITSNYVYVLAAGGNGVFESTNGGTNWTDKTTGLPTPINNIRALPDSGYVYAATESGVYSMDIPPAPPQGIGGIIADGHPRITWTANHEADLDHYEVWRYFQECNYYCPDKSCGSWISLTRIATTTDICYNDLTITAYESCSIPGGVMDRVVYYVKAVDDADNVSGASAGKVFYRGGDDPTKRGVDRPDADKLPESFFLMHNYPNPFNPSTEIAYGLPEDVHVILRVYDVLGREVATLVDEFQPAGSKSIAFNAKDLPSAVYFVRLTATDALGRVRFSESSKLVILK